MNTTHSPASNHAAAASPASTSIDTEHQPDRGLDLAELKKSEVCLGLYQSKLEKSAEWHFLIVVAALGVPYPWLRLVALIISSFLCVKKWKKLIKKHNPHGKYHISWLRPEDYIGDALSYSEVCRVRSRWVTGPRQMRSLAFLVFCFHVAALVFITYELTHDWVNRTSRGPLSAVQPLTIIQPGRPAPLADRAEVNPSLRASP